MRVKIYGDVVKSVRVSGVKVDEVGVLGLVEKEIFKIMCYIDEGRRDVENLDLKLEFECIWKNGNKVVVKKGMLIEWIMEGR